MGRLFEFFVLIRLSLICSLLPWHLRKLQHKKLTVVDKGYCLEGHGLLHIHITTFGFNMLGNSSSSLTLNMKLYTKVLTPSLNHGDFSRALFTAVDRRIALYLAIEFFLDDPTVFDIVAVGTRS